MYEEYTNAKILSNEKLVELFADKEKNRDLIFSSTARLVLRIANELGRNQAIPFEDIVQEGMMALTIAIDRFDVTQNCRFSVFAYKYIKGYILNSLNSNFNKLYRLDDLEERELDNDKYSSTMENSAYLDFCVDTSSNPQSEYQEMIFTTELVKILHILSEREQQCIKKYYLNEKKINLRELAVEMNVSSQAIHSILKGSLQKLRRFMQDDENGVAFNSNLKFFESTLE